MARWMILLSKHYGSTLRLSIEESKRSLSSRTINHFNWSQWLSRLMTIWDKRSLLCSWWEGSKSSSKKWVWMSIWGHMTCRLPLTQVVSLSTYLTQYQLISWKSAFPRSKTGPLKLSIKNFSEMSSRRRRKTSLKVWPATVSTPISLTSKTVTMEISWLTLMVT